MLNILNFLKNRKNTKTTEIVSAISLFLLNDAGSDFPTPYKEKLNSLKLDFSLKSLEHVDHYLSNIQDKFKDMTDEEYTKIVLRVGAYCGEVIRKESPKEFSWITYDDALEINDQVGNFEKDVLTFYVLCRQSSEIVFPMSKVAKYLENGNSESLYSFARVILKK